MSDMIYSGNATEMSILKNAELYSAYVAEMDDFFLK